LAKIYTPLSEEEQAVPGGERDSLRELQAQLPDDYTVIHSANWVTRAAQQTSAYGEVDFVIIAPNGQALLIEQKNGALSWDGGKPYKQYGDRNCYPLTQVTRTRNNLLGCWQAVRAPFLTLHMMVYLPDFFVRRQVPTAINVEIIDSDNKDQLCERVKALLNSASRSRNQAEASVVVDFFLSQFDYRLDVGAVLEKQASAYRWRQNQYSQVISQLSFQPYHLLVEGAAGTGKTQLALDFFQSALSQGKKAAYLCQTRLLADTMASVLESGLQVCTLEAWAQRYLKLQIRHLPKAEKEQLVQEMDSGDDYYDRLLRHYPIPENLLLDMLILDEGQDITDAQFRFVRQFLSTEGRLVVCKDANQQTLPDDCFRFTPTVTLRLTESYRCTPEILAFTRMLTGMVPDSAATGVTVDPGTMLQSYRSVEDMVEYIANTVQLCLDAGLRLDQIIVLTAKAHSKSVFNEINRIGPWPLRWYAGSYTAQGQQIYRDGELAVDTLFRFKGMQRPAVILVEIDSDDWTEYRRRRLYSGCTRARIELKVLMTEQAKTAWEAWCASCVGNLEQQADTSSRTVQA
jgi:archaellum biogenesis ATPase FlaH